MIVKDTRLQKHWVGGVGGERGREVKSVLPKKRKEEHIRLSRLGCFVVRTEGSKGWDYGDLVGREGV
jgi:flagellar biosynthesis/type III secretory pathway ATPase